MGKSSAPSPPDPFAVAAAQGQENRDAAVLQNQLNQVNQYTPYGSLIYSQEDPQVDQGAYDQALTDYETQLADWETQPVDPSFTAGTQGQRILPAAAQGNPNYQGDPFAPGGGGGNSYFGGSYTPGRGEAPTAPNIEDFYTKPQDLNFRVDQTLSPENQQMLDLLNQAGIAFGETANTQLGNVRGSLEQPLDYSSLGPAPVANEQTRLASRDAILDRMAPIWEQDRRRLESRNLSSGLQVGSEASNRSTDDFNRMVTDARLAADQYGGQEMARLFGLEANQRDRAVNEMIQQRQIPLNELNAMLSGSQVQSPQFINPPQAGIGAAPIADSIYSSYQGDLANYASDIQQQNAMMGGLFGLGSAGIGAAGLSSLGAGLGAGAAGAGSAGALSYLASVAPLVAASDRRLKTNIRKVGKLPNGLNTYSFKYIWGGPEKLGVMSDEVRKIMPHAVASVNGFDVVNYSEVLK